MSERSCMLNPVKWRVRRYVVPVPTQERIVRPWQLASPAPAPSHGVAAWGIWPPGWDIDVTPFLLFPQWHFAFRAAFDRAQFATVPPVKQERFEMPLLPEQSFPYTPHPVMPFSTTQFRDEE